MFHIQHSIARNLGLYFITMIAFALLISVFSLYIMWSNQSDAALINVSGSLRMQSYRLLYEMEHHPQSLAQKLVEYQHSLNDPNLLKLEQQLLVPDCVIQHYHNLKLSWQKMAYWIENNDYEAYVFHIEDYVTQVNLFVSELQQFAELKLKIALWVIAISMIFIISFAYFGIWYTHKHIIYPLNQLMTASLQIQNENFNHIKLPTVPLNELGVLSRAFTQMTDQLSKLYASLEKSVEDKTRRLLAVNRSLLVLYHCSQLLTTKAVNQQTLLQVLQTVMDNEHLNGIDLQVYGTEYWNVSIDNSITQKWYFKEISIENNKIALLRWKPSLTCPDERLIKSVSEMIGRSIYILQMQKQQQQMLLMEERAIIARELHDSLAQSLTFFKIQLSLLKHNGETEQNWCKQKSILQDFSNALDNAYSQLRELLDTFRVTIQETNFTLALTQAIHQLQPQTTAKIKLNCQLSPQIFNAQQQVHLLHIIREAIINAIKHAQATLIEIMAYTDADNQHCIIIQDDGIGLPPHSINHNHYGLNIMQERTLQLQGKFSIENRKTAGVKVTILLPPTANKR